MKLEPFIKIILLFSFIPNILYGQYIPMVEEGKFWIYLNYYDSESPSSSVSGHAITFQGDTIINSIGYKKVYKHWLKGWHNCPYPPCWQFNYPYQTESKSLVSFIREDTLSKKVYNLPLSPGGFCDTIEHLIFDFSLEVGDTVNSCIYEFIGAYIDPNTEGIVDSIKTIELFGKNRNTIFTTGIQIYLGDPPVGEVLIVEGIGLNYPYGIFHEPLSLLMDFCEDGMVPCQLILSNSNIETKKDVNIFPNPTKGTFRISIDEQELKSARIYSLIGAFKFEFTNTTKVDISNLETGIYFLELILKSGKRIVKKIINQN